VTLRDLPATLLDLAGIREHPLPGSSLAQAWRHEDAPGEASPILAELWAPRNVEAGVPVAHGYMRSLVEWPFQAIVGGNGVEFLDLADPRAAPPPDRRPPGLEERLRAIPPTPFSGRDLRVEHGGGPPVR
jgi:hypothetical protein